MTAVVLDPLRSRLDLAVEALPAEALPDLMGILEAAKLRVIQRVCAGAAAATGADRAAERFVGAAEMATLLGLPEHWVRDNARRGRIPSVKAGHYRIFDPGAVMAAVRALGAVQDSPSCEAKPRKKRASAQLSRSQRRNTEPVDTKSVQEQVTEGAPTQHGVGGEVDQHGAAGRGTGSLRGVEARDAAR